MKFPEDKHQGKCDHCKSEVPLDAVVCAACGARWGSSTGKTRQQVYDLGKAKVKMGLIGGAFFAVFFLVTIYFESGWMLLSMALGFLAGPICIGWIIGGLISMRRAKTNLSIQWWRQS